MPDLRGALLSFRARGRIGGHRRGWRAPLAVMANIRPFVGGWVPGVLAVGLQVPQYVYSGDPITFTELRVRVTTPSAGLPILIQLIKTGGLVGVVLIAAGANTAFIPITVATLPGDYFEVNLTLVGIPPNQGADLVWVLSGKS